MTQKASENLYALREQLDPGYTHPDQDFQNFLRDDHSSETWVDIGCGTNFFVDEYKNNFNFAFGMDADHRLTSRAIKPLAIADATAMPFADKAVNLVTMFMVAEHLEDPLPHLKEINRVLKEGGRFVCCTVTRDYWMSLLNRVLPDKMKRALLTSLMERMDEDIFPPWYKFNDVRSVKRYLELAAFRQTNVQSYVEYYALNKMVFWGQRILHKFTPLGMTPLLTSHLLIEAYK